MLRNTMRHIRSKKMILFMNLKGELRDLSRQIDFNNLTCNFKSKNSS